jgi:hypothetical protein
MRCPICLDAPAACKAFHAHGGFHSFCYDCIAAWQQLHNSCPTCRAEITRLAPRPSLATTVRVAVCLARGHDALARAKRAVVHGCVSVSGALLQHASEEHRANKSIAMAAVSRDGMSVRFCSPALKNDRDVMLAAVKQNGMALRFATGLRADVEVVKAAVAQDRSAWCFMDNKLLDNAEVAAAMSS